MRPELTLSLLLLLAAAAPLASAICVPRNPKPSANLTPVSGAIDTITKFISSAIPSPKPAPVTAPAPTPSLKPAPVTPPTPTPSPAKPAVLAPATVPRPAAVPDLDAAPTHPPSGAVDPLVKTLCAKSDCPDLCQSSIAAEPQPAGPLDATAVLKLAMNAVRTKVAAARKAATGLISDPKTEKLALGPLNDCVESYDDMDYSLDEADNAIAACDKDTMGTMLDTVRTDVDTCDQGFEDREGLTPLMSEYDDVLAKLSSNCLAIAAAGGLR